YGYAATFDLTHVPYAVLDQDRSAASRQLIARLDGTGVFDRVAELRRAADIGDTIDRQQVVVVVQIGQDFQRKLETGSSVAVQVIGDGRNSNTAGAVMGYVGAIVAAFNAEWQAGHGGGSAPIAIVTRAWFNPNLE